MIPAGNSDRIIVLADILDQIDKARLPDGDARYGDITIDGRWLSILREAVREKFDQVRNAD